MKTLGCVFAIVIGLAFVQGLALAFDDRSDRLKPQSPDLEAGRKAVEAKDYKAAISHLTKAAKETPNDADVHNLLGYSHRHLAQFDKSLEHYRLALNLDPNHRGAHEYIGELYLQMDQLANAEKQLQALYKVCPWFGRCEEYEELKDTIRKYKAKRQ